MNTFYPAECGSVRINRVIVPKMVKAGESVTLTCIFDLEDTPLHSVTWWRGNYHFYQYIADKPDDPTVYEAPGLDVDVSIVYEIYN